jgi:hypothetical protein
MFEMTMHAAARQVAAFCFSAGFNEPDMPRAIYLLRDAARWGL